MTDMLRMFAGLSMRPRIWLRSQYPCSHCSQISWGDVCGLCVRGTYLLYREAMHKSVKCYILARPGAVEAAQIETAAGVEATYLTMMAVLLTVLFYENSVVGKQSNTPHVGADSGDRARGCLGVSVDAVDQRQTMAQLIESRRGRRLVRRRRLRGGGKVFYLVGSRAAR